MKPFNIAILGCGTVGGGVASILTQQKELLSKRAGRPINLKVIAEINPEAASKRFGLDLNLFAGGGKAPSKEEAGQNIVNILNDPEIDLVVETMGGISDFVHDTCLNVVKNQKYLVTANKALLAERGDDIFAMAKQNNLRVGYEAAVCGAIPIIKGIKESFTGDIIENICGIFNGTSNYILTQMDKEGLDFDSALKLAQQNGYAEANPALDINGGDAAHKLILLIKLAYGLKVDMKDLSRDGIEQVTSNEMQFATECGGKIKLICMAKLKDNKVFAQVRPMIVKNDNMLSKVEYAVNAVKLENKYSDSHVLVGKGAGSSETAMSIVSDIVFIARYGSTGESEENFGYTLGDSSTIELPYLVTFRTYNVPGTTGLITTEIGKQNINIETVSHNRCIGEHIVFAVETEKCSFEQIKKAIENIKKANPAMLADEPKILPILM